MKGIVDVHKAEYGVEPEVVVEVPQVTTLLGAFSEFCSGYALMSTNTQGLRVAVSRRSDSQVHAFNSTKKERKKFQLIGIKPRREDRWCTPVKSICQVLQASELSVPGFDLTIKGQSAVADAPSITAAITAGLLMALDSLCGYHLEINSLMRLAYNSNRFSDSYKSRLRDLITIFSSEPGRMLRFDLESYECTPFEYPFTTGSSVRSWFIDCSLPADELAEEVSLFRAEAKEAFARLKEIAPKGIKLRNLPRKEIIQSSLSEDWKRLVSFVIEDSAELVFSHIENLVRLECRQASAFGRGKISMSQLLRASLRMRPDRIIVGEVRGEEVLDMLQAMNTGHAGSMSTGHGNSVNGMLRRLEAMYMMAMPLDIHAIRTQIAEGIDIMVHVEKRGEKDRRTRRRRIQPPDVCDFGRFGTCKAVYGQLQPEIRKAPAFGRHAGDCLGQSERRHRHFRRHALNADRSFYRPADRRLVRSSGFAVYSLFGVRFRQDDYRAAARPTALKRICARD